MKLLDHLCKSCIFTMTTTGYFFLVRYVVLRSHNKVEGHQIALLRSLIPNMTSSFIPEVDYVPHS